MVTKKGSVANARRSILSFVLFVLFVFLAFGSTDTDDDKKRRDSSEKSKAGYSAKKPESNWRLAACNIWVGVKLYYGPSKMYVGEVVCGNESHFDPATGRSFRGVKVLFPSGSVEWKDRNTIISGDWYVKKNDPALSRQVWRSCD